MWVADWGIGGVRRGIETIENRGSKGGLVTRQSRSGAKRGFLEHRLKVQFEII